MQQIQVAWEILQQKHEALVVYKSEVYESLLAQDASGEDLELEMESRDVYRVRFTTMKLRFKKGAHDEEVRSVLQSQQLSTRYQTGKPLHFSDGLSNDPKKLKKLECKLERTSLAYCHDESV
ncbi:hypothetical protein JTB14_036715 [Gonioctena quinquepunctata]|nr:hypothetical protein JTB14_036715 [Gonioctena quinquepunctata]